MNGRARWTRHAEDRIAEMGVRHAEVVEVLTAPEAVYPSPPRYGRNRHVVLGGRLAVVIGLPGPAVLTVLWRGREARHEVRDT